jgi:hypothetical protein
MTRDRFLMAVLVAALLILAVKTVYDSKRQGDRTWRG